MQVKGLSQPVRVHELKGLGALRSRFDLSRARGLTRFVGRDRDMQALDAALEAGGRVVGVVGEAGVGKSRLCFEFLERCRARGIRVTEGRAVSHGKNIPLLPMLQVFRAYYGIEEQDGERAVREKIAGRVTPDRRELPRSPAAALRVLRRARSRASRAAHGSRGASAPDRGRSPPPRAERRGRGHPVIEDLHWIDSASEALLEAWVDAIAGAGGLLLLNFRPEYHADWMQKSWYQQLPLAPLGPEAIGELLGDLLGGDASVSGLAGSPIASRVWDGSGSPNRSAAPRSGG